jgi:NAD(P)-dependent dehydrogenase (short-subunit alcohol dehydrogenase family)
MQHWGKIKEENMDLGIKGKVALVTGGNKGIGKAAALEMAREGCNIAITGRNQADLAAVQKEIKDCGVEALSIAVDMEKAEDVAEAVDRTYKALGRIDILFNNAGHSKPCTPISSTDEDWTRQLDIHLMACVRTCRLIVPKMIKQKWGRIINMSSMYGISPGSGVTDYNAAKAAVINYTQSLAMEYSRFGICATAICPGLIHTEIWDKFADILAGDLGQTRQDVLKAAAERASSVKRYAQPEEVGKVVAFLASECASYITGCTIQVDGGAMAGIEIRMISDWISAK